MSPPHRHSTGAARPLARFTVLVQSLQLKWSIELGLAPPSGPAFYGLHYHNNLIGFRWELKRQQIRFNTFIGRRLFFQPAGILYKQEIIVLYKSLARNSSVFYLGRPKRPKHPTWPPPLWNPSMCETAVNERCVSADPDGQNSFWKRRSTARVIEIWHSQ